MMATMLSTRTHEPTSLGGGGNGRLHKNNNKNTIDYLDPADQDAADDLTIEQLLNDSTPGGLAFLDGSISLKGEGLEDEKAEDAIDYEDIDEVADEDDSEPGKGGDVRVKVEVSDSMDIEMDLGMGGLFGEEGFGGEEGDAGGDMDGLFDEEFEVTESGVIDVDGAQQSYTVGGLLGKLSFESDMTQMDQYENDNLALAVLGDEPRELTKQEELALYWPEFHPHTVLNFNKLIPIKEAKYPFTVAKQPKVLVPTRIALEPAVDTQRSFLRPGPVKAKGQEGPANVVFIWNEDDERQKEKEKKGGSDEELDEKTLRDIEMCCDDWEAKVFPPDSPELVPMREGRAERGHEEEDDLEYEIDIRPMKVSRIMGDMVYWLLFLC